MGLTIKNIKQQGVAQPNQFNIVDQKITIGQLYRGGQTIQKWIEAVKAAERLYTPTRKAYYDLCLDVTIDGFLTSMMEKRVRAVKTSPWSWGQDVPDGVQDLFNAPWFYDMFSQIMDRVFYGYSLIEIKPTRDGMFESEVVPRQNVRGEIGIISYDTYGYEGIHYKEGVYPNYIMEVGKVKELGLLSRLAPYVLMKRDNLVYWAYFNQFFGMPLRVYKYQQGNTQQRKEIETNAAQMSAAGYIILPQGSEMTLQDSNKSGARDTYGDFHKQMNEEIAITILGQTLTTSTDGVGSNALGRVHKAVEEAVNIEDMLVCEYIVNYKFRKIAIAHGVPLQDYKGHFVRLEQMSAAQKMDLAVKANGMGVEFSEEFFWEEFGWDKSHIIVPNDPKDVDNEGANVRASETLAPADGTDVAAWYGGIADDVKHFSFRLSLNAEQEIATAFDKAIELLYKNELADGTIPEELWQAIAKELMMGVETGYKATLETLPVTAPDYGMLKSLRNNVQLFSGFKTHKMLELAKTQLFDEAGVLRTFGKFKEAILTINNEYNVNYLLTEYNLAVGNAQMASKWTDILRDKESLPMLRFRVVKDDATRHRKYDGVTLPVDHPAWSYLSPLLDYGCRCTLQQVAHGEVTKSDAIPELGLIKEQFRYNAGADKVIFPKSHPYYKVQEQYVSQLQAQIDAKIRAMDGN